MGENNAVKSIRRKFCLSQNITSVTLIRSFKGTTVTYAKITHPIFKTL